MRTIYAQYRVLRCRSFKMYRADHTEYMKECDGQRRNIGMTRRDLEAKRTRCDSLVPEYALKGHGVEETEWG